MSAPNVCLNCGTQLAGPYCAQCGQHEVDPDLTLREFLGETTQELAHWEGKVPQTLKTLFLEPGRLTLDFFAGRRARWLTPLRLYLICSVAYFLSVALAERVSHRIGRQLDDMTIRNSDGSKSLRPDARQQIAEGLPARFFGIEKVEHALVNGEKFQRASDTAYSKSIFVLLPFFALLTNVAWRRRMPRYPSHLYFALHIYAAWFGAFAITTLATFFASSTTALVISGTVAMVYGIVYALLALKRVFGDSWLRTILKSAFVASAYLVGVFGVSVLVLAVALASV